MKWIRHIIFIATTVLLLCCNNIIESPDDILPEEKMVEVIAEIEFTQALIKLKISTKDSLINQAQLFNEVFKKFNTSENQFNKSLAYYSEQPKTLDSIYVNVITKLSKRQAETQ
jgi:hypothetical protein